MKLAVLNNEPEVFYSIQGEGASLGKPAIFVRLSLCNLHCVWCDTDYTWNWKGTKFKHNNDNKPEYTKFEKERWITELEDDELFEKVKVFPCKRVIITGGEPLMQQKQLVSFMRLLKENGYTIEVETNGTLLPNESIDTHVDQYNVSPKLSNSNNELKLRIKENALSFFNSTPKSFFKFVIDTEKDLAELFQIIERNSLTKDKIYLMPQGTNAEQLRSKRDWLIDICKESGFNFTDRLHIHLYGDKRGV
ncbi:7-carboxy-7-deazaguanine synthase QueE [Fulvivirga lutea]|uniref:7-carboxy-7-deazaguanine synthase n=1 Tax=Fulvivirga lutea TaxID=2810512 RepID=A0A975A0C2_9BACT|nr:7-carboxy-7-deazaguanine synthase QueE [Fulvivirga lutea]QSE96297.1 7-carboxy-7-deazaguanine synthase QueE [Fulvivirga lutea]